MNKSTKIIIPAVILIILIGSYFILTKKDSTETIPKDTPSSQQPESASPSVIITYDGSGFSSSATSLKSGEFVKVVNNSSNDLDFDSDPHPVHTDNKELNEGDIAPGGSKTFKLTTKGTWGYHNHLDSSQKGTITVE